MEGGRIHTEQEIIRLADELRGILTSQDVETVSSLALAGEYGVALEILATQFYEYGVAVSSGQYRKIAELSGALNVNDRYWQSLTIEGNADDPQGGASPEANPHST
jgi:hypothetical protein